MTRGVQWSLVCFIVLIALIALAGCSHYLFAEREPWRHDAEIACLNTGAVKETPQRVRISAISGPGICGMDYPLRVAALGDNAPLAYDEEPPRPPGNIPTGAIPQDVPPIVSQGWPDALSRKTRPIPNEAEPIQSRALPPVQTSQPPYDPYARTSAPSRSAPVMSGGTGQPLSINAPGVSAAEPDDEEIGIPGRPAASVLRRPPSAIFAGHRSQSWHREPLPPLGPPRGPTVTASAGPVEVSPPATLACPIVAALDQWIGTAVQPAAMRWFRQPVVEIKQISAYSCRGMNGDPNAHISEHAFGNALDIAEFDLADGHVIKRAIWLARHAGGARLSARRAVGGLRSIHDRARARRQRLSLQSHSRRSDAARERTAHLRAGCDSGRRRRRARRRPLRRAALRQQLCRSRRHRFDREPTTAARSRRR